MTEALKLVRPEELRAFMESENYFRPSTLIKLSRKGSDEYERVLGFVVASFKTFCRSIHIPDVEKPRCPECSQITWQVGRSLTAVVCGHCSVAYCMHCCFEQVESPFQTTDLADMRAHLPRCPSNKFPSRRDREAFLHPEIFEQEMARFTIAFLNEVFHLTGPGLGALASIIQDDTWLDAVREGMLISMPHQPRSALPSMVAMFTRHLNAAVKHLSEGAWKSCITVVGIMPVHELKPVKGCGAGAEAVTTEMAKAKAGLKVVAEAVTTEMAKGCGAGAEKPTAEVEVEAAGENEEAKADAKAGTHTEVVMLAASAATAEQAEGKEEAKSEAKVETGAEMEAAMEEQAEGNEEANKADAKVEMETTVAEGAGAAAAAAAAAAAEDGSALQIEDAGLTAASSAALAKTDGSDDRVTLLPSWSAEFFTLTAIAGACPAMVVMSAFKVLDLAPSGVKIYVEAVAGILRVPASIHSAIAMRFTVQAYLHEDSTAERATILPGLLRHLYNDVTLQGSAAPLIRHLDAVARDASPDFVDLTVLYLTALLKLQILPDVGRPRKLPFGKYGDYWAVEKVAEEEYPTGQIRSIMTSLVHSPDIWSVDALSLFTSTFISRPIQRAVLTDHRAEAGFLSKTEGVTRLSGWLPTVIHKCVGTAVLWL